MRLYIASSWRNANAVNRFAELFRLWGHEVYSFAEVAPGNVIFNWTDIVSPDDDGITCLKYPQSIEAHKSDKYSMDWAEACILILPAGKDSHLEAGYIKGQGKKLFILGCFTKGEFSNQYHLADGLFRLSEIDNLKMVLNDLRCNRTLHHNGGIYYCLKSVGHEADQHLFELPDVDTRIEG